MLTRAFHAHKCAHTHSAWAALVSLLVRHAVQARLPKIFFFFRPAANGKDSLLSLVNGYKNVSLTAMSPCHTERRWDWKTQTHREEERWMCVCVCARKRTRAWMCSVYDGEERKREGGKKRGKGREGTNPWMPSFPRSIPPMPFSIIALLEPVSFFFQLQWAWNGFVTLRRAILGHKWPRQL